MISKKQITTATRREAKTKTLTTEDTETTEKDKGRLRSVVLFLCVPAVSPWFKKGL
jgi:hypothetical protein